MSSGWVGPTWGEPSPAMATPPPVRARAGAPTANYRADGGQSADFIVVAASVAGSAHRLGGGRCEDSFGWVKPGPWRLGLMIADGVSTAGRGGEGADMAIDAAGRYLASSPAWDEGACQAAAGCANNELVRAGGADPEKAAGVLSTTFVVALLTAEPGGARVSLGRVGDSTAFRLEAGEWEELFTAPESDDLHHMVTDVLPFPVNDGQAPVETVSVHLPFGAAIVLVTDGIANPLRDGPSTVAPALSQVLSGGPEGDLSPLALAAAADFSRRGCHDDRAVVAAWPRSPVQPV